MNPWPTKIQGPVAVIGDIHGQLSLFDSVLNQLKKLPRFDDTWIVLIGDLVDRGPDTAGVVQRLLELRESHRKTTAIFGNHELAMLGALGWVSTPDFAEWNPRWVQFYDSEPTFRSYGVEPGDLEGLARAIPPAHRQLLTGLPWVVEHPENIFVHAGLDPNQPTDMQLRILHEKDWTLVRPPWLCDKALAAGDGPTDNWRRIVSGHVPVPEVVSRPKRLLIDTTGGVSGELSCVILPEGKIIQSFGGSERGKLSAAETAAAQHAKPAIPGGDAVNRRAPGGPGRTSHRAEAEQVERDSSRGDRNSSRSRSGGSAPTKVEPAKMSWWKRLLG